MHAVIEYTVIRKWGDHPPWQVLQTYWTDNSVDEACARHTAHASTVSMMTQPLFIRND